MMNIEPCTSSAESCRSGPVFPEKAYLLFTVENTSYAVENHYVRAVQRLRQVENPPEVNQFYKGTVLYGNSIIPVLDLRLRYRPENGLYQSSQLIILKNLRRSCAGLVADSVQGVRGMAGDVRPADDRVRFSSGICTHDNHPVFILDCERMIGYSDLNYYINSVHA